MTVAEDRMIRLWGNANRQKKRENGELIVTLFNDERCPLSVSLSLIDPSGHTSRSASIDSFIGGGIPVGGSTR